MSTQPSPSTFDILGDETDPLIGRMINQRYKVVEAIGHGGMGKVYKALQSPLDRVVALKVLGAGHDRDPNFYKRFFLEASVTAKLTHPNTITLFDYGRTDDGIFFIAMEFLTGRTLSQAMQGDGPLGQERVIHIAQQICRSLREAHALGIIHRDLKPANVMLLQQQDDHDFVKVLDFGLVKFFSGDNPEGEITNAGTFMGSPHYIAPEQARNQNPDQRCDIYSLGVLLYHMLTGKVPFTAANPVDIILKHLHDPPVPPLQARPDLNLDPALQDVVLKCLAKDREQRYQSMDELLVALKQVRAALTGISGPHSMPPRADTLDGLKPVSPNQVPNTPVSMQTPAYGQSALLATTPSQPIPRVRASMPPPPPPDDDSAPARTPSRPMRVPGPPPSFAGVSNAKKSSAPLLVVGGVVLLAAIGGGWFALRGQNPVVARVPEAPPAPAPVAAAPAPAAPAPAAPAPAAADKPAFETALQGTTLVTVASTPAGAEVRDVDERLLGLTPFELRVPHNKPLQLTLKLDGYKPYVIKQKSVSGERLSLSGALKKDPKSELGKIVDPVPGKRSVGYKDDPY